ncbi:response regulator [Cesiribacter andamanensis]|uniref:Respiratory response protein A n=1 Tax=Cesiribacter andamanensis AMV16 TaxID=1279009 RepID=M7P035_9BACT|nr:response regulator [Cesiribacter andamanensis]EMR03979.1 respiratory response protein A [Cesiribacter andamanensis AMV16]
MEKSILIVDDSETIRETVSFTLENAQYKVQKAVDGEDALQLLDKHQYQLIITDLHMPRLDGIGLIKAIRAREAHQFTPILFLTTESQTSRKDEARAAGATGWIVKPFVPEKLVAVVQKLIR